MLIALVLLALLALVFGLVTAAKWLIIVAVAIVIVAVVRGFVAGGNRYDRL